MRFERAVLPCGDEQWNSQLHLVKGYIRCMFGVLISPVAIHYIGVFKKIS